MFGLVFSINKAHGGNYRKVTETPPTALLPGEAASPLGGVFVFLPPVSFTCARPPPAAVPQPLPGLWGLGMLAELLGKPQAWGADIYLPAFSHVF